MLWNEKIQESYKAMKAGMGDSQASLVHEHVHISIDVMKESLVTREDFKSEMKDVRSEINDVRSEINDVRSEIRFLRSEIEFNNKQLRTEMEGISKDLKAEMKAMFNDLRADIASIKTTVLMWVFSTLVAVAAVAVAVVKVMER
jgi:chromosome segregation ATPase